MGARAIWKGVLKIGSSALPVKLYAAVQERDVRFHVLKRETKSRVKQKMVTGEKREEVAPADIRKGYEVEPGTFVVLEKEELEKFKPQESREIKATRFVPLSAIGHEWFERPYYLGPDGPEGDGGPNGDEAKYFALIKALETKEACGIVRWSMRGKSYVGALRVEFGYLTLIKLRYAQEVLPARDLPAPTGRAFEPKELQMASELVTALAGRFEPEEFRDEYRDRLKKFIEAKTKGKHPRLPAVKEKTVATSLNAQLARSLAAIKRQEKKVA